MPDGSKRIRDVTREAADVRAFRNDAAKRDILQESFVALRQIPSRPVHFREIMDRDVPQLKLDVFARSRSRVSSFSPDFERRIDRRLLLDLAGETGENRFDCV